MSDEFVLSYAIPVVGFQSRKAAQMCAYFAVKSEGTIEKLKLAKLVYLAERRFLEETSYPLLFDVFYSLPHGPICSGVLNGIDGIVHEVIWGEFLARNGNLVVALKKFPRETFDEMSDAEIENLQETWSQFGKKTASQLRNYTHEHCPEYTETKKGRIAITYKEVFKALGVAEKEAEMLDNEIKSCRRAEALLSS